MHYILRYCILAFFMLPFVMLGQDMKLLKVDMENIFKSLPQSERKMLIDGYINAFNSDFLLQEDKDKIDGAFQQLKNLSMPAVPEMRDFVACVGGFGHGQERDNLMVWLGGLDKALHATGQKRTIIKAYLAKTAPIVSGSVLHASANHKWTVKGELRWEGGENIKVYYNKVNLTCSTQKDSITIYNTRGYLHLDSDQLTGRGGKVVWKNRGEENMYAELTKYEIDLKASEYTADSVYFHYKTKYERPLLGRLKDHASKYDPGKDIVYPEFSSYDLDIETDNIFPDITFRGGVSYAGMKFAGIGSDEQPAVFRISRDDTINITLHSKKFMFDSVRVIAGHAEFTIEMDSGQINHPDIQFVYSIPDHAITVKRSTDRGKHSPFKDSYHNVLLDMEEVTWKIDSHYMEMSMSGRAGMYKATIESVNYFSDDIYDNIQGMDAINPLNGLLKCADRLQSDVFSINDYTSFMKIPAHQLRKQIILLSHKDFVDYNEERDEVTLKPRLFDYTKARVGKQDYDNIRFVSQPADSKVNAVLDLRNNNVEIDGVRYVVISETHKIFAEPRDQKIILMKNRDMEFSGRLYAGLIDMFGANMYFSYEDYVVNMPKVDSTVMYLAGEEKNQRGPKIKSLIWDMAGDIAIGSPDNKSGKKEEEKDYPILNSRKESYIYFDHSSVRNGQYRRNNFYYVVEPCIIEGISDAENLSYSFNGTLVSNIVEPITNSLQLMEDNSLGMIYETPAKGLELYGKGNLKSKITLDTRGFVAAGDVKINNSGFSSDSILMLPTRMEAATDHIIVDKIENQRPGVKGEKVTIAYLPKTEVLNVTTTENPFDLYEGRMKHSGTVMVYENTLDAAGKLELKDAFLDSKLLHLHHDMILSESTAFNIASVSNESVQLNTSDVAAQIDLIKNIGRFINNKESDKVKFISNNYLCSFKNFTWYMEDEYLNFGVESEQELARIWKIEDPAKIPPQGKNIFTSTDYSADSLSFIAPLARYDLKTGDISCHWVNHIEVANGKFYPDSGNIYIEPNGVIKELKGGNLASGRRSSLRMLTNVDFKLQGRYNFSGSGDYNYMNENKENIPIRFTTIGCDTIKKIYAAVELEEENALTLNNGLIFKGNLTLSSIHPNLKYSGFIGLTADKDFLEHNWVAVNNHLDASKIRVPLKTENYNEEEERIHNGIYLQTDKVFKPYAAFLSGRRFYADDLLIGGEGMLEWADSLKQYIIKDLKDKYYYFKYDPVNYDIAARGRLNMELNIQGMSQKAVGKINYDLKEEELSITNMLYAMDFSLTNMIAEVMAKDFINSKLYGGDIISDTEQRAYVDEKAVLAENKLKRSSGGMSDSLRHSLVLDSLNFKWIPKTNSYVANGQANVLAVLGNSIGKMMNIKMEISRRRTSNQFFIYLYDNDIWYYLEYAEQHFFVLSSNERFNEMVRNEKIENKQIKITNGKEKEILYTVTLCPNNKRTRFINRIK